MRTTRGLRYSEIRLMVPPLPAASRPSKTTTIRAPASRVHSCTFTNSVCSRNNSASYTSAGTLRRLRFGSTPADSLSAFFLPIGEWYCRAVLRGFQQFGECGPGTLVINRLNTRAEYVVATRIPIACNVGGAKPDSVTIVRASTTLVAVEWLSVACVICDSRTTGLPSPIGKSTRNGDTSLIAWPGPALVSRSASGYTDIGAIARTLAVAVTGS